MFLAAALWIAITTLTVRALGGDPTMPVGLAFVGVTAILIPLDLRTRRLPRGVLFGGLAVVLTVQMATAFTVDELDRMVGVAIGTVAAGLCLIVAQRAAPGGPNLGDAAFAALAGGVLGWYGLDRVGLGLGLGLVTAAIVAGPITLAVRREVVAVSPAIGLRPALAAGTWIALCWGDAIISWYGG